MSGLVRDVSEVIASQFGLIRLCSVREFVKEKEWAQLVRWVGSLSFGRGGVLHNGSGPGDTGAAVGEGCGLRGLVAF